MNSSSQKSDTLTVDGTEYTVEWDGEHVVLREGDSAHGLGRSDPTFKTKEWALRPGEWLVTLGDNDNSWAFETKAEAIHFHVVLESVMRRHLAAAREAGRREALGRCPSVDNLRQRCCREAGHPGWHETEKKTAPQGLR